MMMNNPERSGAMRAERMTRDENLKKYLAGLQYGPGGLGDREIAAQQGVRDATANLYNAKANIATPAEAMYHKAMAGKTGAETTALDFSNMMEKKLESPMLNKKIAELNFDTSWFGEQFNKNIAAGNQYYGTDDPSIQYFDPKTGSYIRGKKKDVAVPNPMLSPSTTEPSEEAIGEENIDVPYSPYNVQPLSQVTSYPKSARPRYSPGLFGKQY